MALWEQTNFEPEIKDSICPGCGQTKQDCICPLDVSNLGLNFTYKNVVNHEINIRDPRRIPQNGGRTGELPDGEPRV